MYLYIYVYIHTHTHNVLCVYKSVEYTYTYILCVCLSVCLVSSICHWRHAAIRGQFAGISFLLYVSPRNQNQVVRPVAISTTHQTISPDQVKTLKMANMEAELHLQGITEAPTGIKSTSLSMADGRKSISPVSDNAEDRAHH